MELYYKAGTHVGFEDSPVGWSKVGPVYNVVESNEHSVSNYIQNRIPLEVNLPMKAGETYAFYLTSSGGNDRILNVVDNSLNVGSIYLSNNDLEILYGTGRAYSFQTDFLHCGFAGTVHYLLEEDFSWNLFLPAILGGKAPITGALNDTGITWSGNYESGNNTECISSTTPDGDNVVEAQDCSHGRDVTHNDDSDDSDGHAGFSYTKLGSDGQPLANQDADYGTTPWACVQDNVTGLIWEVKTDDGGLHDKDDTYNWYNTDPATNGGDDGYEDDDGDICYGYDSGDSSTFCNTEAYVNRVNAAGWCGASDWRMPTRKELESIVLYDRYSPAIDAEYFPNAVSSSVWSGSPHAYYANYAWKVYFYSGYSYYKYRAYRYAVRLVRGGQ